MPYAAHLVATSPDDVEAFRADPGSPLHASRVEQCPHDLTAIDIVPLGPVLAEAIDIGLPLRNDGWHPLRPPVVVDPETVMARSMKLEDAWRSAEPELAGMMAEVLGADIDRVRALYAHASARGEAVVSYLSPPDEPERAARTLVPAVLVG